MKEKFKKISTWLSENKGLISFGLSAIVGGILAYLGFQRGVQKTIRSKNESEIKNLKTQAENTILKEKLADEKKSINEISQDVDDMLDR